MTDGMKRLKGGLYKRQERQAVGVKEGSATNVAVIQAKQDGQFREISQIKV